MDFTELLAFLSTPTGAVILEGIGKGIVTFAQHNKQHLGIADAPLAAGGQALESGAGPVGAAEAVGLTALGA